MAARILVIAEHEQGRLNQATRRAVSAALKIGGGPAGQVDVLVAGENAADIARQAAALAGVALVKLAQAPHYAAPTAEELAALILAQAGGYTHLLAAASTLGRNVLPRVAAALGVEPLSAVVGILSADVFVRPIYAGNALETIRSADPVKVLTVRASAFAAAAEGGNAAIEAVETPAAIPAVGQSQMLERRIAASERPALDAARVVVAGGRGLGSAENFQALLAPLADRLGAALGASYGAVAAGYASNEMQVGQTGRIVAPDLYLAVGISGAIQHLAGIKDAKVIVAIDRDPDAPIFKLADYAWVADLFEAVPALLRALGTAKA